MTTFTWKVANLDRTTANGKLHQLRHLVCLGKTLPSF
jgi:hypothetical protein